MIIRNIHYLCLMMAFAIFETVADFNVKINIYPKSVSPGDDLTVECLIYNTTLSDRLKTYLSCPFVEKTLEYCYADCIDICQYIDCSNKGKLIKRFVCSRDDSNNPMVFSYKIPALSNEQINNRKTLPFSCKYKGLEVRDNVTVIESIPQPHKPITGNSIISTVQPTSVKKYANFFDLELRNIILIVLISSLITSFLINIWCCVQCCVRSTKTKKRKKKEKLRSSQSIQSTKMSNERLLFDTNIPQLMEENGYPTNYRTEDNIRRAKSQPLLVNNNAKGNPVRVSTSNLNRLQTGSMNNNNRQSIYNGSFNDFYHQGSIPVFDPNSQQIIGYTCSPMIPMNNFIYQQHPNDRMNVSQSEDLNTLTEQNTPERRQSSTNQPLPTKPEECFSNLDSASSSHIV